MVNILILESTSEFVEDISIMPRSPMSLSLPHTDNSPDSG